MVENALETQQLALEKIKRALHPLRIECDLTPDDQRVLTHMFMQAEREILRTARNANWRRSVLKAELDELSSLRSKLLGLPSRTGMGFVEE